MLYQYVDIIKSSPPSATGDGQSAVAGGRRLRNIMCVNMYVCIYIYIYIYIHVERERDIIIIRIITTILLIIIIMTTIRGR